MPAESPSMIFATPTKVVSEAGSTVEYLGTNRVPDLQRIFQVMRRLFISTLYLYSLHSESTSHNKGS